MTIDRLWPRFVATGARWRAWKIIQSKIRSDANLGKSRLMIGDRLVFKRFRTD